MNGLRFCFIAIFILAVALPEASCRIKKKLASLMETVESQTSMIDSLKSQVKDLDSELSDLKKVVASQGRTIEAQDDQMTKFSLELVIIKQALKVDGIKVTNPSTGTNTIEREVISSDGGKSSIELSGIKQTGPNDNMIRTSIRSSNFDFGMAQPLDPKNFESALSENTAQVDDVAQTGRESEIEGLIASLTESGGLADSTNLLGISNVEQIGDLFSSILGEVTSETFGEFNASSSNTIGISGISQVSGEKSTISAGVSSNTQAGTGSTGSGSGNDGSSSGSGTSGSGSSTSGSGSSTSGSGSSTSGSSTSGSGSSSSGSESESSSSFEPKSPVAFNAYFDKTTLLGEKNTIMAFNAVTYNFGDGFDPTTGIFTCPVDGTYSFFVNVMNQDTKTFMKIILVKEDKPVDFALGFGPFGQGSCTVNVPMKAGERIWVQQEFKAKFIGFFYTMFSGHLLANQCC